MVLRRSPVYGTTEPGLFEGERYGNFDYAIPVASGRYGLTLHGLQANAQGKLVIRFQPIVTYPLVDAIEVVNEPSGGGKR